MGTTPPRVSKGTILKHPLFDFDNSSKGGTILAMLIMVLKLQITNIIHSNANYGSAAGFMLRR